MSARRCKEDRNAGFTVLELLIALCILSLFSIYAATAYQQIRRMNEMIVRTEATSSAVAVQNHVRNLLSGARPVMVKTAEQSLPAVAFSGSETGMTFVVASDGTLEAGGLYVASLKARSREDGLADFVTTRRPFQRPSSSSTEDGVQILLEGIAALRFRYFGAASAGAPHSWQSQWVFKETLPELVEVTISMPSGKRQVWPQVIVRPVSGP